MPQEAPADTAGPSSPPPRMPEGWLPQWEGVQRKWYYVQRATGKSQWEIPTEPVVLTPSTTPTSIGTGPSQVPSRPSTNSPQVTGLANKLAGRIDAVAASARTSSSLDAQLNGQSADPSIGHPGKPGWYHDQTGQHMGHVYHQNAHVGEGGYSSGLHHNGAPRNISVEPSAYYPGHPLANHVVGQQPFIGNSWGHAGQASGYNMHPQDSYQNLAMGLQHSHQMEAYSSSAAIDECQVPGLGADQPPQPQWRVEQQPAHQSAPHYTVATNSSSANSSRPYLGSYPTPQTSGWSHGNFTSRSSQSSEPSHPGGDYNANRAAQQTGHPMSRSQSHHSLFHQQVSPEVGSSGNPQPHGYSQQPIPSHVQYSGANMVNSQSGMGFNSMVFPPALEAQSMGQFYPNPPSQPGVHQYLPQQHPNTHGGNIPGAGYSHQYAQATGQYNQWRGSDQHMSRVSASDSQFISGPWGSSPPASGLPPSTRYE
ncbi:hypothetical protein N7520_008195 [Penicillium odoratum]|uniref:uncharacterized protein n=1 Tax=Penicillium odoratum TaxID=1167516 RepID=UPI0025466A7B|nr:uncharacterized protein N7520_008195 [Penicillium odoratum]KAJ5761039.1 hypothetical protein N7520_008195 [Penicillium odoratum]